MERVEQSADIGPAPPYAVELHLHRGPGLWYGSLGVLLLALGAGIAASNVLAGRFITALVVAVLLPMLGIYFFQIGRSMLLTRLTADDVGLRGRTPDGAKFDAHWEALRIDGDENALLVEIADETVRLNRHGWVGFWTFVALVYRTPAANARLTPAAEQQVSQILRDATSENPNDDIPF
jgi:hypothetical protein